MSASDDFCFISVSGSCVLAKGRVTSFVIGLLKTDFFLVNVLFFFVIQTLILEIFFMSFCQVENV